VVAVSRGRIGRTRSFSRRRPRFWFLVKSRLSARPPLLSRSFCGFGLAMDDDQIRTLVARFDTNDNSVRNEAWQQLRELDERVVPFFEDFFGHAKKLAARRDIAFHCIRYARTSEAAFRVGLLAIGDKSTIVRYRGCCVLAYSLRRDALAALTGLLDHSDAKTVEDAKAAIDAIRNQNHHYFVDRGHSGQMFWEV